MRRSISGRADGLMNVFENYNFSHYTYTFSSVLNKSYVVLNSFALSKTLSLFTLMYEAGCVSVNYDIFDVLFTIEVNLEKNHL